MTPRLRTAFTLLFFWGYLQFLNSGGACAAQASFLERGIARYNAGDYSEALNLLGAAEPSEFNNSILHYYMANAYLKTGLKQDAIREYKIAGALQPKGSVGEYSRRALESLGATKSESSLLKLGSVPPGGAGEYKTASRGSANNGEANSWLSEQLALLDKQHEEQKEVLEKQAERETKEANDRAVKDRESVTYNVPQQLSVGRGRLTPNLDYDLAMSRIETDTINKINEINSNLRRKKAALDAEMEQRARAYEGAGNRTNETTTAQRSGVETMPLATATSQRYVNSSEVMKNSKAVQRPALPATLTPLGWIPLNIRMNVGYRTGLLVSLESDGSWEKDGPGQRMWKGELIEEQGIKNSWQDWQGQVTDTIRDALLSYKEEHKNDHSITTNSTVAFRMQIDRNGDLVKITPVGLSTDPADPTVIFINYLKDFVKSKSFASIPSSSGAHLVYVHAQTKTTEPIPNSSKPWWQD